MAELIEEKSNISNMLNDAKAFIKQQDDDITRHRATIKDLTNQLTSSYNAREEGAIRAARLVQY